MGRTALVFGQLFQVNNLLTLRIYYWVHCVWLWVHIMFCQVFGVKAEERPLIHNITFYVMSSNDEAGLAAGQYWTSLLVWALHTYSTYIHRVDIDAYIILLIRLGRGLLWRTTTCMRTRPLPPPFPALTTVHPRHSSTTLPTQPRPWVETTYLTGTVGICIDV